MFGNIDYMVVDELDTFLDSGKEDILSEILTQILGLNYLKDPNLSESKADKFKHLQSRQVVLVSATMSKRIESLI